MAKIKNRQKILVVCQHFWPENFRLNDICDFFAEKGCEVDVLCGTPNYPGGKFFVGYNFFNKRTEKHNGVTIHRVFEIPRGNNSNFRIFINYMVFPIASIFHIPLLLRKNYDKIYIYQLSPVNMSIAGIIIGKIKNIEITFHVLDLWPENLLSVINIKNKILKKILTRFSHWHYKKTDKLVVLSNKMKEQLKPLTKLPNNKILILPQACEKIYELEVVDSKLNNRFKNSFNIVFAGNISPAQSFETIICAAKLLGNDGILNINWIIVGDGMSRQWLEKKVAENNLRNFYFEGYKPIEDIPKYTSVADLLIGCLVKSNLLEATIPAKVLSYVAAGKPIVLAMDGEAQDLINEKIKCGYAGPAGDAEKLYENIKKVYSLPVEKRIKLGSNAKSYHYKYLERGLVLNNLYGFIFDKQ